MPYNIKIFFCDRLFLRRTLAANPDLVVSRVASNTHAGGQLRIGRYYFDGALAGYCESSQTCKLFLFNFHSHYRHGCLASCSSGRDPQENLQQKTRGTDNKIRQLLEDLGGIIPPPGLQIEYETEWDCPSHNNIPDLGEKETIKVGQRLVNYPNMLESIWSGQRSGFVVVQDLELCRTARSPHMGFCIQRTGTNQNYNYNIARFSLTHHTFYRSPTAKLR